MDHVETLFDAAHRIAAALLEQRDLRRAIDRDKARFELQIDAVARDIGFECGHIGSNAEQRGRGIVELDLGTAENPRAFPAVA